MIRMMTLAVAVGVAAPGRQDADWFPVTKGTTWIYDVDGKEQRVVVDGLDEIDDVECAAITTFLEKDQTKTEWFAVDKEGVTFHRNRVSDGKQRSQATPEPAIPRLKFGTKKGDTWEWKGTISGKDEEAKYTHEGEEEIEVPAGKFACVKVRTDAKNEQGTYGVERWYAKGVGIVKSIVKAGDKRIESRLKKFEPLKKEPPKEF